MNDLKPNHTLRDRDITVEPVSRRAMLTKIAMTGLTLAAVAGEAVAAPAAGNPGPLVDLVGNGPAAGRARKPELTDADAADRGRPGRRGAPNPGLQDRSDCDPNDVAGSRPDRGELSDLVAGRCRR